MQIFCHDFGHVLRVAAVASDVDGSGVSFEVTFDNYEEAETAVRQAEYACFDMAFAVADPDSW